MINAGKYNHKISIYNAVIAEDSSGFQVVTPDTTAVLTPYANIKTTKGITLIKNNSDFEKAFTNFTIRYPRSVVINRDMLILYNNRIYTIEYINDVNEAHEELEIQAKEIKH